MSRFFSIFIGCTLLFAQAVRAESSAGQREAFQQAYAALKAGKTSVFASLPASLRQYPLYPWLEYEYLRQEFDDIPDAQIIDFTLRNPGSVMADALYARFAERLASRQDWQKLLTTIPADLDDTDTQCYRTQALAAVGQKQEALANGKRVWMTLNENLPDSCAAVIDLLRRHVQLSTDDYWERLRDAIDKNRITFARELAASLPQEQRDAVDLRIRLRKDPADTLPLAFKQAESPYLREAIAYGLSRLARKKPQQAETLWQQARQTFAFTPQESAQVESTLGMYEALDHKPAALTRLAKIPPEFRTEDGNLWLARIAAREGDWNSVLDATQQLSFDHERDASAWEYWRARALEETGKKQEANTLYSKIAHISNFHGFLAADRLGQAYDSLELPPTDRNQRIAGLQKVAAIQRAFEWFALGERARGRSEWFRVLKEMDTEGKLATAELATRSGDPNLAIWTISRAKEWDEVNLRFPLVHTDTVMEQARKQGVNPAWIFGVMRQESAFDTYAESGAKALGLMQLIPPTARHVAGKLGLSVRGKEDILHPTTNIQLGSAYLRDMLNRFNGNYAQATAAYNAGPGRPPQWAPTRTIPAEQWVESIPFSETRRYVQAVLAYTTIYDHKLNNGKGQRLSERLLPVAPNPPKVADNLQK